ncbi:MAG: hypothetical protein H0T68_09440 [Gemmatimonadales bacterium]|nr:hypothetical protein [Gemmatimonadales bacterium]
MRTRSLVSLLAGALLIPCLGAACSGDDLLLPSSATPTGLRAVSGDRQEAEAGAMLPDPLVVKATDATQRPVQGVRIVFRFDGAVGGDVAPDTALTNLAGEAEAEIRLGTASGAQLVDATVIEGPAEVMVTFRLTALPPEEGGGGGEGGGGNGGGGDGGGVDGGGGGGNDGGGDDDDDDEKHDD